jgi:uncharacterized protein (TIGR02246 family)
MRMIIAAMVLGALAGCQKPAPESKPVDTDAEVAAIRQMETAQIKAIQMRDAAGSAANYADDAVFVNEDGKPVEGAPAIGEAFTAMVRDPALAFDYKQGRMVVSKGGDLAYSTATYSVTYTDPKTGKPATSTGSNLSVWQKDANGKWKLVADNNAGKPAG